MPRVLALTLAALIAVSGCGGGGSQKPAKPAKPSPPSAGGGGVVTAEPTKGLIGPVATLVNGKLTIVGHTAPLSPKENRPTDAQRNGVAGVGACASTSANPSPSNLHAMSAAIRCLLNAERAAKGLPKLRTNGQLGRAARSWANRMVAGRFFAHEAGSSSPLSRIKRTGYVRGNWTVGENLAWGSGALATPRAIVNGWMHSPPHRSNILFGKFRDIGIGIRLGAPGANLSGGATYVTDFGRHG